MEPTKQDVDDALQQLERPPFITDAEKRNLPISNQHDQGGKRLDVDSTLERSQPQHDRRRR